MTPANQRLLDSIGIACDAALEADNEGARKALAYVYEIVFQAAQAQEWLQEKAQERVGGRN